MKPLNKKLIAFLSIILFLQGFNGVVKAAEKGDVTITINYFVTNNTLPYLLVNVKSKIDGKFQPVGNIPLKLFLDKDSTGTFIGAVITNDHGTAVANIPPSVQKEWAISVKHTFLANFEGNKQFEASKADLTVGRAKILIDATSDKTITASVLELKDEVWTPVKGVDVVLAVRRMDADLPINETPTFTTDSTGKASGDFKRDSIPGDQNGNILLVAKIIDNDQYGNLSIEKSVPWGSKFIYISTFNKRTLFATRDKAPVWLLLVAGSIILAVWGILFLLVMNIFKIRKLGQEV